MTYSDPEVPGLGVPQAALQQPPAALLPVGPLIQSFRSRAHRLRLTAFAILGIICLLLFSGATVFVLAPQLTLTDLYPQDLDKKIKEVGEQTSKVNKEVLEIVEKRSKMEEEWRRPLLQTYRDYLRSIAREIPMSLGDLHNRNMSEVLFIGSDDELRDAAAMAEHFETRAKQGKQTNEIVLILGDERLGTSYALDRDSSRKFRDFLRSIGPKVLAIPQLDDETRRILFEKEESLKIHRRALDHLQKLKAEQGLATILGQSPVPQDKGAANKTGARDESIRGSADSSFPQLLQTNITRFGTIVMIIFLVSILTPLYRYNIRLATYYDARGDVLALLDTRVGSIGFVELALSLTPSFDFGKAPATPMEQAIELARQIVGAKGGAPGKKAEG